MAISKLKNVFWKLLELTNTDTVDVNSDDDDEDDDDRAPSYNLSKGSITSIDQLRKSYFNWAYSSTEYNIFEIVAVDMYVRKIFYLLGYLESLNINIVYVD